MPAGTEGAGTTGVLYPEEGTTGAGALDGTTEGSGTGGTTIMSVMGTNGDGLIAKLTLVAGGGNGSRSRRRLRRNLGGNSVARAGSGSGRRGLE